MSKPTKSTIDYEQEIYGLKLQLKDTNSLSEKLRDRLDEANRRLGETNARVDDLNNKLDVIDKRVDNISDKTIKLDERLDPIKKIIWGLVGAILLTFLTFILSATGWKP